MFTIKKPVTINKTIRLPQELVLTLEHIASEHDISFNQLIIQCCEYALENLETQLDQSFKPELKKGGN